MNRNVILVLCVVVGITALLLVGKHGSKNPQPANATATAAGGQGADTSALVPAPGDPKKGTLAPDFTLKSIPSGQSVQLSSLRGKAVLVNFWATYCGPCKIEMPWLEELQKKYGPQGFQIVGVAMDETSDKPIVDFVHSMGVNYTIVKGTSQVGDMYGGVDRLPLSYFVDRSGKIVHEIVGLVSESEIENAIKESLGSGS